MDNTTKNQSFESKGLEKPNVGADDRFKNLAEHISAVLRHPNVPEGLKEKIRLNLNDLYNEADIEDFESSPVYIGAVLRGYEKGRARR